MGLNQDQIKIQNGIWKYLIMSISEKHNIKKFEGYSESSA